MRISDWSSDVCSSDLAIDAAVIGLTDRGMLQRVARANEESRNRLIDDMPEPWEGFRDELREKVNGVIVSLRPDHGTDRKSVVSGKSVSVRVDLVCRRIIKKKKEHTNISHKKQQ